MKRIVCALGLFFSFMFTLLELYWMMSGIWICALLFLFFLFWCWVFITLLDETWEA